MELRWLSICPRTSGCIQLRRELLHAPPFVSSMLFRVFWGLPGKAPLSLPSQRACGAHSCLPCRCGNRYCHHRLFSSWFSVPSCFPGPKYWRNWIPPPQPFSPSRAGHSGQLVSLAGGPGLGVPAFPWDPQHPLCLLVGRLAFCVVVFVVFFNSY